MTKVKAKWFVVYCHDCNEFLDTDLNQWDARESRDYHADRWDHHVQILAEVV